LEVSSTNGDLTDACLGSNAVTISKYFIITALQIRQSLSLTDFTFKKIKEFYALKNNVVYDISEDVLNSLANTNLIFTA
jgi:hypothetical protein